MKYQTGLDFDVYETKVDVEAIGNWEFEIIGQFKKNFHN